MGAAFGEGMVGDDDDHGGGQPPAHARWMLWTFGILIAVVLLAGAVAGALRSPAEFPPDSPEGAVQGYVQAVLDGEDEVASGYFSADLARTCSAPDFRNAGPVDPSLTVTLEEVRHRAEHVEVEVRLRSLSGAPPFDAYESSYTERFLLVEEDGAWKLDGESPWPVHFCRHP